jgi:hypothetical protein
MRAPAWTGRVIRSELMDTPLVQIELASTDRWPILLLDAGN